MFKETFFKNEKKLEIQIGTALELERDGYKDAARHLMTKLVIKNPSCIECRDHMGRMYVEDNKFINSKDVKDFMKNMK